jgi:hypothetical protein
MLVYTAVPRSRRRKGKKILPSRKPKPLPASTYVPSAGPYRRSDTSHLPSLVTNAAFVPSRTSVMDPVMLARESPEVQQQIIAKSKRLAPQFNKGAVQYITEEQDLTVLGRKIR